MKFFTSIFSLALPLTAMAYDATYHLGFEDANYPIANLACSDGINGLLTRGYRVRGNLPRFPFVGSAPQVTGWNSPACGTCWRLSFEGRTIHILAVDRATSYDLSLPAMNELTGGRAVQLGRVGVHAEQVATHHCGM